MRTLSATLLSAQKEASRRPYVKVEALDQFAGVVRPIMERLYTGSEPDYHHGVTEPGDGSLVRARMDPTSGDVYVQRVANPGSASDFSPWSLLTAATSGANISLVSLGADVRLFYVSSANGRTIYQRTSNDYGATWGAANTVLTPAVTQVLWVAAAMKSGTVTLFYVSDEPVVYVTQRSGGPWSNPLGWSNNVNAVNGIAAHHNRDWNVLIAGTATDADEKLWSCIYGDGLDQATGTWSSLREVTTAAGGSQVSFHSPFLHRADIYRLFCVEKFSGDAAYNRPIWSHLQAGSTFVDNRWREPVPFDLSSQYGVALAGNSGILWLSTPSGVWQGSVVPSPVDLTADVLNLEIREDPLGGGATVVLRNDDGRYSPPLEGGPFDALRKGSELRVSPGYYTSLGAEASQGPSFFIQGWEYRTGSGRAEMVVVASSPWALLEQWHARRQYTWDAGDATILDILRFLLARMGLALATDSTSPAVTTQTPAFTVHPGESGSSAVRRLLRMVPDVLFFRGFTATLRYPQASDAVDYSYGTDHAILRGGYGDGTLGANRFQVYGSAGMDETFRWAEVNEVLDRLVQVHDVNLDTPAKRQERAQASLRQAVLDTTIAHVAVPANCGQELYDVVSVTDAGAGLTAASYRVQGLALEFARRGATTYRHRLRLTAV